MVDVGQEDGAERLQVVGSRIVWEHGGDGKPGAPGAQRGLEEEGFVFGANRSRVAVDDEDAQPARSLDPAGPSIVERKVVGVDHHLGLVRAADARVVHEALAGAAARRHVDEPAGHLVAVEPQGDAEILDGGGGEVRDLRDDRHPLRALFWRRLGRQRHHGPVLPGRAAAGIEDDDFRSAAGELGVTSSQPDACKSVTT